MLTKQKGHKSLPELLSVDVMEEGNGEPWGIWRTSILCRENSNTQEDAMPWGLEGNKEVAWLEWNE